MEELFFQSSQISKCRWPVAMAFKRDGKLAFRICHTELRAPALHEHAKGVHGCAWRQSRKIHNKWNGITKNGIIQFILLTIIHASTPNPITKVEVISNGISIILLHTVSQIFHKHVLAQKGWHQGFWPEKLEDCGCNSPIWERAGTDLYAVWAGQEIKR